MLPVGMVQNNPSYYRNSICIRLVAWNFGVCLQYRIYYFVDKQNDWKSKSGNFISENDGFFWILINRFNPQLNVKNCFLVQGLWMGSFTALSQLSGTLAPLIASWIYKDYGTYLTFTCSMLLSFLSVVLNVAYFKRFKYRTDE